MQTVDVGAGLRFLYSMYNLSPYVILATGILIFTFLGYREDGGSQAFLSAFTSGAMTLSIYVLTFFNIDLAILFAAILFSVVIVDFIKRFAKTKTFMPNGLMLLAMCGSQTVILISYVCFSNGALLNTFYGHLY